MRSLLDISSLFTLVAFFGLLTTATHAKRAPALGQIEMTKIGQWKACQQVGATTLWAKFIGRNLLVGC